MMRKEIVCVLDDKVEPGFVELNVYTKAQRTFNALKILGILWLIAGFTVFVPILHFVLVPLFAILGVVGFVSAWMTKAKIKEGEFVCPSCKVQNKMTPQDESFPKNIRCTSCYMTLRVDFKEPVAVN